MAGEDDDADEPDVADAEPGEGSEESKPSGTGEPSDPDPGTDDDGVADADGVNDASKADAPAGEIGDSDEATGESTPPEGVETEADAATVDGDPEPDEDEPADEPSADAMDGTPDVDTVAGESAMTDEASAAEGDDDHDAPSNPWEQVGGEDAVETEGFDGAASDPADGEEPVAETGAPESDDGPSQDDESDEEPADWETWFQGEEEPPEESQTDVDSTASGSEAGFEDTDLEATVAADDADRFGSDAGGVFGDRNAPDEDQEMPLTAHVEEMLKRLAVVVAIAGIVSLLTFPFADRLINIIWYGILPGTDVARPRVYGILSLLFTRIKVASLAGIIAALPVLVYQTYQFMHPGLYPHERRYYLAAIPTSLVLALVGVSFAYFIVLPAIFTYFLYYSESVATIGFALMKTFDLILLLMGYLAIVFQIPLFIMLAMMMGLVTRRWLADRRLIFWGAFLGISFLFSPDPTGMAPFIVALTMVGLFEGTLLVTKWAGR